MASPPRQWQRIQEIERASVLLWYFAAGVALIGGTVFAMRYELAHAQPGLVGMAGALLGAIGPLLFFLLGLVFVGASVYTMIEKGRNKLWLELELPVSPGDRLRARLGSDRALAAVGGVELEATLSCKRKEIQASIDSNAKQQTQLAEKPVWSAKQRIPLVTGLRHCEFELDIPADALPGDPGAEGIYSGKRGILWSVDVYFERNNVYVNRSYRFLMSPRA